MKIVTNTYNCSLMSVISTMFLNAKIFFIRAVNNPASHLCLSKEDRKYCLKSCAINNFTIIGIHLILQEGLDIQDIKVGWCGIPVFEQLGDFNRGPLVNVAGRELRNVRLLHFTNINLKST